MQRNRYIYTQSHATLVVKSSKGKGGTWQGAIQSLKHRYAPVICWQNHALGNQALIQAGAIPVSDQWDGAINTIYADFEQQSQQLAQEKAKQQQLQEQQGQQDLLAQPELFGLQETQETPETQESKVPQKPQVTQEPPLPQETKETKKTQKAQELQEQPKSPRAKAQPQQSCPKASKTPKTQKTKKTKQTHKTTLESADDSLPLLSGLIND